MKKPVIGITAVTAFNVRLHAQRITYPNAVWAAGGEAVFLPCNSNTDNVEQIVNMLDGLLVPGGADIDPQLYGEEVLPVCGAYIRSEDDYDIALIKETIRRCSGGLYRGSRRFLSWLCQLKICEDPERCTGKGCIASWIAGYERCQLYKPAIRWEQNPIGRGIPANVYEIDKNLNEYIFGYNESWRKNKAECKCITYGRILKVHMEIFQ